MTGTSVKIVLSDRLTDYASIIAMQPSKGISFSNPTLELPADIWAGDDGIHLKIGGGSNPFIHLILEHGVVARTLKTTLPAWVEHIVKVPKEGDK